jgi:hypothetical protein
MDDFIMEFPSTPKIEDIESSLPQLVIDTRKERRIRREFLQGLFLCLCFLPVLVCVCVFLYFDLSFMGSIRFAINYAINFVLTRLLKTLNTGNLIYLITD